MVSFLQGLRLFFCFELCSQDHIKIGSILHLFSKIILNKVSALSLPAKPILQIIIFVKILQHETNYLF